jgi:hypothetical protein
MGLLGAVRDGLDAYDHPAKSVGARRTMLARGVLMSRFSGLIIRVAIIAVVGIVLFVFRDRLSGGAGDLAVGDCFDDPGVVTEVQDVQHHPCNEPHTSEVLYVGDMPSSDTYPSETQFRAAVQAACVPAFKTYTGLDFATDAIFDLGYFIPTTDGWGSGDRELICYAIRLDGAPVSQSLRVAQ